VYKIMHLPILQTKMFAQKAVLDLVSGLCMRRNMSGNSKIVVGATLQEGERVTHCN
jgi:hypothetical protein